MILERPEEPGKKYAMAFTFMVHAGLILALFLGVQWKRSTPEVMDVELWSSKPTPATYVPPPPPPKPEPEVKPEPKPIPKVEPKPEPVPPKKPDIVVKEEKKPPKPEPKKPDPKPEPPKPEPKKPEPKAFDFSKELARETATKQPRPSTQQLANAAAAESEQRAASNRRGQEAYATKIRIKIRSNVVLPPGIQGNPEAGFIVDQLPTGEILAVKLKRSSGNPGLDQAIERALLKSSPLPKPDDPALFERSLEIKYKPFEE